MESTIIPAGKRQPWNKGRLIGQRPPLRLKDIWAIRIHLQLAGRPRDLALFNLAIDSKLRGCDLVALRVCDVAQGNRILPRATVLQRKTQRPVQLHDFPVPEAGEPTHVAGVPLLAALALCADDERIIEARLNRCEFYLGATPCA